IREAIVASRDVPAVIHMRTMHLGPEELLVAAKVAVDLRDDAREVAQAINDAEERIRRAVPIARLIYLEPDVLRTEERDRWRATATGHAGRSGSWRPRSSPRWRVSAARPGRRSWSSGCTANRRTRPSTRSCTGCTRKAWSRGPGPGGTTTTGSPWTSRRWSPTGCTSTCGTRATP